MEHIILMAAVSAAFCILLVTCLEAGPASRPALPPEARQVQECILSCSQLKATFRDNSRSSITLSGIQALFNEKAAPGFDAFDPDSPGASAGINFEHIFAGHENPHNAFTPRKGPYDLYRLDNRSVMLVRAAKDSPWRVSSTLQYTLTPPHYVDFEFRCRATDPKLFEPHGYAAFFFASYMHDVKDEAIHFRGRAAGNENETWIRADASQQHADWNQGGTYRHVEAGNLPVDADVGFRLNHWSYDWPRYSLPFYYGEAAHDMTYMLMFDRSCTKRDEIRFSLFKFKLNQWPRPAWDFQYVIHHVEADREYGFKGRAVWKRFVSPDDCLQEYRDWHRSLERSETGPEAGQKRPRHVNSVKEDRD